MFRRRARAGPTVNCALKKAAALVRAECALQLYLLTRRERAEQPASTRRRGLSVIHANVRFRLIAPPRPAREAGIERQLGAKKTHARFATRAAESPAVADFVDASQER